MRKNRKLNNEEENNLISDHYRLNDIYQDANRKLYQSARLNDQTEFNQILATMKDSKSKMDKIEKILDSQE